MKNKVIYFLISLIFILGCSPKIGQEVTSQTPQEVTSSPPLDEKLSPCGKFSDATDEETAVNSHVIYRDFLRQEEYDQALPYWRTAYKLAPAADGKRNTHYADGIRFFEHFYSLEENVQKKERLVDSIFMFYDQIEECYGGTGYVAGRKAFDLYYKYKDRATKDEIYNLFKKSIDTDRDSTHFFILNPFTDLLVRRYFDDKIDVEEAKRYEGLIRGRLQLGLESGENKAQWEIINEYVPQRLEAFEGVPGFYNCDYYKTKYWTDYLEDSTNCEVIGQVYGKLRRGGCDSASTDLRLLVEAGKRHCIVETQPTESQLAYQALREGLYEEAVSRFLEAAKTTDDPERKANYLLLVSKIYYRDLKVFPKSREYALQAAELKPDWGEPYLLIGRLYASSGPLCGPGRGWDSQIVVWPAIDKWNHAKRIDPTAAAEANKWIGRYAQYMPSVEDVFQRSLKEGASFRVGCWIQENTVIRAAK